MKVKMRHVFCIAIVLSLLYLMTGDCKKANAANLTLDQTSNQGYELQDEETIIVDTNKFWVVNQTMPEKFKKIKHIIVKQEYDSINSFNISCFKNAVSITIPANVTYVDSNIVLNLPKLQKFNVEKGNPAYTSVDGVLYSKSGEELILYPHGASTKVSVKKGTKIIGERAFYQAPITKVTIPNGLVSIHELAFAETNLTSISLPVSFRLLMEDSFQNSSLESVAIASKNPSLCSVDGVLYNKAKTSLYYWPEKKVVRNLIFPETLSYLDCKKIPCFSCAATITIPNALTAIVNTESNQLEEIKIKSTHPYFKLYDGVLYSSNYKYIRLYPNQNKDTEITLHKKLQVFPMTLFYAENTTKVLELPANLKALKGSIQENQTLLSGFRHLQKLKLDESNPRFKIVDGVLYNADQTTLLWYPSDLQQSTFSIPESVQLVDNEQLVIQNNLTELTIPKNCCVYYIDTNQEFGYSIVVPIGKECPKLEKFMVHQDNPYYCSVDGVLFSKDMRLLYMYPSQKKDKTYTIPDGVKEALFINRNSYLTKLIIPKSFRSLGIERYYDSAAHPAFGDSLVYYTALSEISVEEGNECLEIVDGALVSSVDKTIYAYPMARKATTFTIPVETYEISNVLFFTQHPYLKTVYVNPKSMEYYIDGVILRAKNAFSLDLDFTPIELKYIEY